MCRADMERNGQCAEDVVMSNNRITQVGRALAFLWAGFWLWFGIASALSGGNLPSAFAHLSVPAVLIVIAAVAAWRRPTIGGALLVAEGLALASLIATGMLRQSFFLAITLALPPIAAGVLLLIGSLEAPIHGARGRA